MIVRKLRLQRGWSQEQLAQLSGLSVRTIQRIERGQTAGLESLKSIAAVLEVDLVTLTENGAEKMDKAVSVEEQRAIEYVRDIKGFYSHLVSYVLVMALLVVINLSSSSESLWVVWPALGWGMGVIAHGASVFELFTLFGPDWEKKQVEKRLGKKL